MRLPVAGTISTKDGTSNKNARMTNMLINQKKDVAKACVRPALNTIVSGSGAGNNMVCFNGELVNIFGTDIKRVTASGGDTLNDPNTGTTLRYIGSNTTGSYLDQLVLTKGAARYTSGYTPECLTSGTDSLDANVVMRLQFEGADDSTTITDDKGHTITNASSNKIKTDQYTCGSSSLKMTSGALTFPYSADWNLGTGDFCIECRVRFYDLTAIDYGADITLLGVYDSISPYGGYRFVLSPDEGTEEIIGMALVKHGISIILYEGFSALSQNVWYSFAVSRDDGVVRLFKDGVLLDEADTNTYSLTSIGTMGAGFYDHALMP